MHILLYFEVASLLICILNFGKLKKDRVFQWFLLLLILTNIVEWGTQIKVFTIHLKNGKTSSNFAYNIFNPLEFGFFAYYYYHIFDSPPKKALVKKIYLFLLLFAIINIFFIQGIIYLDSYTYILGCLFFSWFSVMFFKQLSRNPEDINILKSPHFWVNSGVLLFYSGEFFLFIFFEYFLKTNGFLLFYPAWNFFTNFLNIIFYTCISISFFYFQTPHKIS